jgi:hypothetical protein
LGLYTSDIRIQSRTNAVGREVSETIPISILGRIPLTSHGQSQPSTLYEHKFRMDTRIRSDEIRTSSEMNERIRRGIDFGNKIFQRMRLPKISKDTNVLQHIILHNDMKVRVLQESVSFLNPFELDNSHEGFSRTPLTMHNEAAGTEVNAEGFSRTPLTMHNEAAGTEVNAEGFSRTPLTMHNEAAGTEVNAEGFSRTPLTMHNRAAGTEVNAVIMNLEHSIQITPEVLEDTSEGVLNDLQLGNQSYTEIHIHRGGSNSNNYRRRKEKI